MARKCDFSGWATRANVRCADGRTIMKGAFQQNDGQKVPLVWNHAHNDPQGVLGHAVLEDREDGVYAYCFFNDTPNAKAIKLAVQHGDITGLSIYANQLQQQGGLVTSGNIRELSLVMAAANPGAYIDPISLAHGEESDTEAIIYSGEPLSLAHSADGEGNGGDESKSPTEADEESAKDEETVADVYQTLTDKQKKVVDYMVGQALAHSDESEEPVETETEEVEEPEDEDGDSDDEEIKHSDEGGDNIMKHNIFDKEQQETVQTSVLSHSDQVQIIASAKERSVGTLQAAISMFAEGNESLKHGIDDIEALFPDYKDLRPGAPELIQRDQGWVTVVMNKIHKSPFSRIRTRQMDARMTTLRAKGYKKGKEKQPSGNMKLIKRTTDPQTVYRIDALNRDDIIDITDFDVVEYQYGVMRQNLYEEIATAIMIGDGREEGDEDKISEEHIRSIWNDDDLYTIHVDIDIAAIRKELQGSNTSANFGENYIYAEALITSALYAREKYKGTGTPDLFCDPHILNVMLLARDLNGRRIYASKAELAQALNVGDIYTAEQFEGLVRKDAQLKEHKLLGILVNLADYSVGSTKGGEITRFNQFDIDFNQEKYLIEARLSGALTRLWSAIALEEPVAATSGGSNPGAAG